MSMWNDDVELGLGVRRRKSKNLPNVVVGGPISTKSPRLHDEADEGF